MHKLIEPKFNIEIKGLKFLGRGPKVFGDKNGWSRSENIIYKCVECGSEMSASYNDYWNCKCGAIHLDIDAGRFGSKYGDENILVYLKEELKDAQNIKNKTKISIIDFLKKLFNFPSQKK